MKLTFPIDSIFMVRWQVDEYYNNHDYYKRHTGSMMYLGKGAVVSSSIKQILNAKSSTESELVWVDESVPILIFRKYCIEAQGYTVNLNILYQDNRSTIILEKWKIIHFEEKKAYQSDILNKPM